ncbi:MAG TPA: hypothetical protein VLE53_02775 [Gemmatimonadaceae bacterium]|nr:hypothetical protein [Gemmatimonadaceae bacterium]
MTRHGALRGILGLLCATTLAEAQSDLPGWRLAEPPLLTIGEDGAPATEFSRIEAAIRLSDGTLAIANGATSEIRLFDRGGRYLRSFGRRGAGPGEFGTLRWVGRSGDTVFLFDARLRRITTVLLGPEPRLLNTLPVAARGERGPFYIAGRFIDGRWLATTFATPGFNGPPGPHRLPGSVGTIASGADGEVRWLGQFENITVFIHNPTGDVRDAAVGPIAFSPGLYAQVSGATAWVGDSNGDSLSLFSSAGTRTTVRLPIAQQRVTQVVIEAARARETETARGGRGESWVSAKYSPARVPERFPFFQALIPAPRGELWVEEYTGLRTYAAAYLVVDSGGTPRARVTVPRGVRVVEAGHDYVVGVHEDDDGVESVRLYRLTRR